MKMYIILGKYKVNKQPIIRKDCLHNVYREVIDIQNNNKLSIITDLTLRNLLEKDRIIPPHWIDGFIKNNQSNW